MVKRQAKVTESLKRVKHSTTKKETKTKEVDLVASEAALREFDLNVDYGPLVGISRLDRLLRAESFNLPVKPEISKILKDSELIQAHPELNLNIWHDLENII